MVGFAGDPARTTGRSSLPSRCDSTTPGRGRSAPSSNGPRESPGPASDAVSTTESTRRPPSRRSIAIVPAAGSREASILDQTPSSTGARPTTRSRRPPSGELEPGTPIGLEPERETVTAVGAPARDQRSAASARGPGREPDPGRDDQPVTRAQSRIVRNLDEGAGVHRLAPRLAEGGDLDRRRGAARQPDDGRLEPGHRRDHHPQALARQRREPVGVADDEVPVGGRAHPSAGGAALTSAIASATCSQDHRKSSIGWLSAGCSR